jgi:hypothetical protein
MFGIIYYKLAKLLQNKNHRLCIDVFVAALVAYFTLKKYFGWSLTSWLSTVFTSQVVLIVEYPLLALATYASLVKIVLLIVDAYPATKVKITEPEGLNHCCLRINEEITRHLASIIESPSSAVTTFTAHHNFKVNVALVVLSLSDHIKNTLSGARTRDIFISVYSVPHFEDLEAPRDSLEYLTHADPKKDFINSRTITLSDGAFSQYECVKCIKSTRETHLVLDCKTQYFKTPSKRHKTVRHYIGMKLQVNGKLLGFANIELHNNQFFATDDEMSEYVETHLVAFRYLLEYQFLKRSFFETIATKILNQ